MDKVKIDLLKEQYDFGETPKKTRRFLLLKLFLVLVVSSAIIGFAFSFKLHSNSSYDTFSFFSSVAQLVLSDNRALDGEDDDRINFLLLGVGGAGHDGPELSDTIMFASFRPSTKEIGFLSIPRDLAVPIPGYDWRKINHANAFGEIEETGSGPELASQVVSELLDQEIHYHVKVNFDGFVELIDAIGGIEIYVERSFIDNQYPTDDYLVQTVYFEEGWQTMDGETALQFARSRHGSNGEGSDFARAARQQKVLLAAKEKMLSTSTLLNPNKIKKLLDTVSGNLNTNLAFMDVIQFTSYLPEINDQTISHQVLDSSVDSPLYATNLNGAYVLLPKNDDWTPVQQMAANIFHEESDVIDADAPDEPPGKYARIEIQNGTEISGFAFQSSQLLEREGYDVTQIGNAADRGYTHTVIYDLTNGTKADELAHLKTTLEGNVSMSAGAWIFSNDVVPTQLTITDEFAETQATDDTIDFLVILGENTANFVMR